MFCRAALYAASEAYVNNKIIFSDCNSHTGNS